MKTPGRGVTAPRPGREAAIAAAERRYIDNPPPPLTPEQQHVIREAFRIERPSATTKPSDESE